MNEREGEATHGVDAHIPSDTEQFDKMAEQPPKLTPAQEKMVVQVRRLNSYANYLSTVKNGPISMLVDAHIHKNLTRAEWIVVWDILKEKLGVSDEEFTNKVTEELEKQISMFQMDHKIIITPDGTVREDEDYARRD